MYIFPPSVDCKRLSPLARLPSSKFLHRVAFHTSFSTAYFLICQPETAQKSYDAHPPQEKAIPMGRQWHIMEHKPLGIYDLQHAQRPQAAASQLLMYEVRRRRLTPPMYDVRCTMYDCRARARCAGQHSRSERNVMKLCTGGGA